MKFRQINRVCLTNAAKASRELFRSINSRYHNIFEILYMIWKLDANSVTIYIRNKIIIDDLSDRFKNGFVKYKVQWNFVNTFDLNIDCIMNHLLIGNAFVGCFRGLIRESMHVSFPKIGRWGKFAWKYTGKCVNDVLRSSCS